MAERWFGLVELLLVFGVILGWAGWQWWVWWRWRRQQRSDASRPAHSEPPTD